LAKPESGDFETRGAKFRNLVNALPGVKPVV
jgi:hypothetical protein